MQIRLDNTNTQGSKIDIKKDKVTTNENGLKSLSGEKITQMYFIEFQKETIKNTLYNNNTQLSILDILSNKNSLKAEELLSNIDFESIGYDGKNILDMNEDELNELISEDGFFGITNTANRIADFIINGANGDIKKLKEGFEGMKQGFKEAENMWGGKLPQISQKTMDKAIEKVNAKINEFGLNSLDINI